MNSIDDITNAFYINLESRTDRKEHVEKQLNTIGIKAERFNAVKLPNGALGCSISHLKCLELAIERNLSHVLIVEDDIEFLKPTLFMKQLNTFLKTHQSWDVVMFAGNNIPPYTKVDDTCVKVGSCQTTTGYLVNGHYFSTLIQNFCNGVNNLMRFPHLHTLYAIDKYWFPLQKKDDWYLIIPLTVVQREDYSDIEQKNMNYINLMTDLDKEYLITRQHIIQFNNLIPMTPASQQLPLNGTLPRVSNKSNMKMQI